MPAESTDTTNEPTGRADGGKTGREPRKSGGTKAFARPSRFRKGAGGSRAESREADRQPAPAEAAQAGAREGAAQPKRGRRPSRFRGARPGAEQGAKPAAGEGDGKPGRGAGPRARRPRKHQRRPPRFRRGSAKRRPPAAPGNEEAEFEEIRKSMIENGTAPLDLSSLKGLSITDLFQKARDTGLSTTAGSRRQDLVHGILLESGEQAALIHVEGVVESMKEGFGFLRFAEYNYLSAPHDIYLSPQLIRKHKLRTGDTVEGFARPAREGERYFALVKVHAVNFESPEVAKTKILFDNLTPLYPQGRFKLETTMHNLSGRVMDLLAPIGKGQRGLIVSPPRTGKTMLLQAIANSITTNDPDAYLIVLLIDERPEEVTDMKRSVRGEVISSTFDEPATQHVHIAQLVIEKAKRLVEHKRNVVILLDSITRLARAYNTVAPPSGKILSGGVDSNALQRPKRFFGAARNIEEGGSLTIVATALVETGSRMDEVIFEEFKGTGNMEAHLDRKLVDKRIFPAIDPARSGTRKEELLLPADTLNKVWVLRRVLSSLQIVESAELLLDRMSKTRTNTEFLASMTSR